MKRIRQYVGILTALVVYYIIHEGAHLLFALANGVFKQINFMALGVQIDVFRDRMTDTQLGWFCLVGPLATFIVAWLFVLLSRRLRPVKNNAEKMLLACCWYTSIILLVLDPLYLSVIYRFVGGGDMNGIKLLIPETAAAITSGAVLVMHIFVLWKKLLPRYKKAFDTKRHLKNKK